MTDSSNQSHWWTLLVLSGISYVMSGCLGPGKTDLLESQLREQERQLLAYEREIGNVRSQLSIAQREARILRQQIADAGAKPASVEATEAIASAEGLKFNSLLTAGQNKDEQPGDERFHAVVYPYDPNGELVKVIGKMTVEAIDLSLPEAERTVGRWEFDSEEAQELWHNGFLSQGYRLDLPWQKLPNSKEVLLNVTLETADGRSLTAHHTCKIEPPTVLLASAESPELVTPPENVQQAEAVRETVTEPEASDEKAGSAVLEPTSTGEPPVPEDVLKQNRPAPVLDLFEEAKLNQPTEPIQTVSFKQQTSDVDLSTTPNSKPKPFPAPVQTSDAWTDATIPTIR